MRKFKLNKLIRDQPFDSMVEMGQKLDYKVLAKAEFLPALADKLVEESKEVKAAIGDKTQALKELAECLDVVEEIGKELGLSFDELRQLQTKRRQERGGFDKKVFMHTTELADDDKWVKYYAADPQKYPENITDLGEVADILQRVAIKGVVVRDGKILLLRKALYDGNGGKEGKWNNPGGRVEPGELWNEALLREIYEETGLTDIEIGTPVFVGQWTPIINGKPTQITCTFMICQSRRGDVNLNSEHDQFAWIDPEDHTLYEILSPEHEVIQAYLELSRQ